MSKIIAIQSPADVRYYIAGHPTEGASYGYPSPGGIKTERAQVKFTGALWPEVQWEDFEQVGTEISGTTVRTFATDAEATAFEVMWTGVVWAGTAIVLYPQGGGIFSKWTAAKAVLMLTINARSGRALTIGYTLRAGPYAADTDEDLNQKISTDAGENIVTDEGDNIIASSS